MIDLRATYAIEGGTVRRVGPVTPAPIPPRFATADARRATIRELHAASCSDMEIGRRLGLSGRRVGQVRAKMGLAVVQRAA